MMKLLGMWVLSFAGIIAWSLACAWQDRKRRREISRLEEWWNADGR